MKASKLLFPFLAIFIGYGTCQNDSKKPRFRHKTGYIPYVLGQSCDDTYPCVRWHPWISEHREWLGAQPDSFDLLCSLDSPLRPTNFGRNMSDMSTPIIGTLSANTTAASQCTPPHSYPADLFHSIEIHHSDGIMREGRYVHGNPWVGLRRRLLELLECLAAMHDMESFKVKIDFEGSEPFPPGPWNRNVEVSSLFVEVLTSLPNLRRLALDTPQWSLTEVPELVSPEDAAAARAANMDGVELPSVAHVDISRGVPVNFLPPLVFPNLDSLATDVRPKHLDPLIDTLRHARNLTRLWLGVGRYLSDRHDNTLESILSATPGSLASLNLHGPLARPMRQRERQDGKSEVDVLKTALDVIAKHPNIKQLHLPDLEDLGMNYDGGPACGNAYMGASGREFLRRLDRRYAETADLAGETVMMKLPWLEELSFGALKPLHIGRNEEEEYPTLTWPWTGRLEEWLGPAVTDFVGPHNPEYYGV